MRRSAQKVEALLPPCWGAGSGLFPSNPLNRVTSSPCCRRGNASAQHSADLGGRVKPRASSALSSDTCDGQPCPPCAPELSEHISKSSRPYTCVRLHCLKSVSHGWEGRWAPASPRPCPQAGHECWGPIRNQGLFKIIIYLLFLAALGLRCCVRAFSSCGEWGLLFIAVRGLLIAVASLVAEHGL